MLILGMALSELIDGMSPEQRLALVCVVIGCVSVVTLVLGIIAAATYATAKRHEHDTELKRDLVGQGKSAEEIERIINPADGFSRAIEGWSRKRK